MLQTGGSKRGFSISKLFSQMYLKEHGGKKDFTLAGMWFDKSAKF